MGSAVANGAQRRRAHPQCGRGQGDERFVLDAAPERVERLLVSEVVRLEAAVHAEQLVGAALVGAERLDEQLGAVGADTEVRRRPAGVDPGPLESLHGQPDGVEPVDHRLHGRST